MSIEILGLVAGSITTLCWLPQAFKTIRTRDTRSLSLATQASFLLGVGLWLIYGYLRGDTALIAANAVTMVVLAVIVAMKLRYG